MKPEMSDYSVLEPVKPHPGFKWSLNSPMDQTVVEARWQMNACGRGLIQGPRPSRSVGETEAHCNKFQVLFIYFLLFSDYTKTFAVH